MSFLQSANFFFQINFFKKFFQSVKQFGFRSGPTFVGPDLDPNCLQRLSANHKSQLARNLTVKK